MSRSFWWFNKGIVVLSCGCVSFRFFKEVRAELSRGALIYTRKRFVVERTSCIWSIMVCEFYCWVEWHNAIVCTLISNINGGSVPGIMSHDAHTQKIPVSNQGHMISAIANSKRKEKVALIYCRRLLYTVFIFVK